MRVWRRQYASAAGLMGHECPSSANCTDCIGCDRLRAILGSLGHVAEVMEIPHVKGMLDEIKTEIPKGGEMVTQGQIDRIVEKLLQFQDVIRPLCSTPKRGFIE